jgi:deoxyribonuclease-4
MYLGAHVSTSGGVDRAPANGVQLGCEAIQVFTKNQMQWRAKPLSGEEITAYKNAFSASGISVAVSHDSYLINLCSPEEVKLLQSITSFEDEVERCELLGIPYLVFHPGSHMGAGEKEGLKTIAASLNQVLDKKKGYSTQLLLEITAGQGTNLGCTFEQLAEIIDQVKDQSRVGVCVDSCHLFAAGYDIRAKAGYEETFKKLDAVIGLKKVKAFHLNDSKKGLGSKVDRHEHIGQGALGLEAFRLLVNDDRFQGLPMLLETPGGDAEYEKNLQALKELRSGGSKGKKSRS